MFYAWTQKRLDNLPGGSIYNAFSVLFDFPPFSVDIAHCSVAEREQNREYQSRTRRNNSRNRPRSQKKKRDWFQILSFAESDLHANLSESGSKPIHTIILAQICIDPLEILMRENLPF